MTATTPSPELLLPAGDMTKLKYAVAYGADAVYLGLPMASLRTPTKGDYFTPATLGPAIEYCHQHGVKAYVTLNIFASNHDLKRIIPHLEQCEALGADAMIISDAGIVRLAQRHAPSIPIHISTQANTLNVSACAFWQDLGVERVILAREVPIREMAQIHEELPDLELECFIHGSLCVAYSGRCVISDYLTDNTKNSNKGMCGNSCRWEFEAVEKTRLDEVYTFQEDQHGSYMLNSKDLCLVKLLPELLDAGICSLKVEGRTKGIHYVGTVGKVYREAIDACVAGPRPSDDQFEVWEAELKTAAHRGFTEGFSHGRPTSTAYRYDMPHSISTASFVALSDGSINPQGYLKLIGRNAFYAQDTLNWMTPEGSVQFKPEEILDDKGFRLEQVNPNQSVWVKPPGQFSTEALAWSLVRRYEQDGSPTLAQTHANELKETTVVS